MRGVDRRRDGLFSYVRPESRIPKDHPLRLIRQVTDEAPASLNELFAALYSEIGRPSIPPEQLLGALSLQAFCSNGCRVSRRPRNRRGEFEPFARRLARLKRVGDNALRTA